MRSLLGILIVVTVSGCSATSLRCGTEGDSTFVELYNVPQNFSQNLRAYADLCGFVYDTQPVARLNIIGEEE
jgi:hypothetical protein